MSIGFIDFAAIFLSGVLLLVYLPWIIYNFSSSLEPDYVMDYLQRCPYCTRVFYIYHPQNYYKCPGCQSLIKEDQFAIPNKQ